VTKMEEYTVELYGEKYEVMTGAELSMRMQTCYHHSDNDRYFVAKTKDVPLYMTQNGRKLKKGCRGCRATLMVAKKHKIKRVVLRFYNESRVPDVLAVIVSDEDLEALRSAVEVKEYGEA